MAGLVCHATPHVASKGLSVSQFLQVPHDRLSVEQRQCSCLILFHIPWCSTGLPVQWCGVHLDFSSNVRNCRAFTALRAREIAPATLPQSISSMSWNVPVVLLSNPVTANWFHSCPHYLCTVSKSCAMRLQCEGSGKHQPIPHTCNNNENRSWFHCGSVPLVSLFNTMKIKGKTLPMAAFPHVNQFGVVSMKSARALSLRWSRIVEHIKSIESSQTSTMKRNGTRTGNKRCLHYTYKRPRWETSGNTARTIRQVVLTSRT